jgi:YbbR domain-containing protein
MPRSGAADMKEGATFSWLRNLNLKILAFAFALVLYSLSHGAQDAQRVVAINLVALLPPDASQKALVTSLPPQVKATIRGPRQLLDDVRVEDLGTLQIDLRGGTEHRVNLEPSMVRAPAGLRVEQIDPPFLELAWEDVVERDMPVLVSVLGTPARGFVVRGTLTADPATVHVRGPRTEVQLLQHVRAEPFDVSGLTEGAHVRTLPLQTPRGRMLLSATQVEVRTEVAREVVERILERVPVVVTGTAKGRTQPGEVDVRLQCPPEVARAVRRDQVIPHVHLEPSSPTGTMSVRVVINVDRCEAHAVPSAVIVRW